MFIIKCQLIFFLLLHLVVILLFVHVFFFCHSVALSICALCVSIVSRIGWCKCFCRVHYFYCDIALRVLCAGCRLLSLSFVWSNNRKNRNQKKRMAIPIVYYVCLMCFSLSTIHFLARFRLMVCVCVCGLNLELFTLWWCGNISAKKTKNHLQCRNYCGITRYQMKTKARQKYCAASQWNDGNCNN